MMKKIVLCFLCGSLLFSSFSGHAYAQNRVTEAEKEGAFYHPFYHYVEPEDELYQRQWSLKNIGEVGFSEGIDIGLEEAWKKHEGEGREVIVAIIDTGIDVEHEDLQNVFWVNKGEIPDNQIDDDQNGFIDDIHGWNFYHNTDIIYMDEEDKHGTHIAGIIAANTNGIGISGIVGNGKVKIMVLKTLGGDKRTGDTYSIRDAIQYAEKNGAKICNLSFGTMKSDLNLWNSIKNSKMLFTVAAGNGNASRVGYNIDKAPIYPAAYNLDNVITVANMDRNGFLHSSSNYGVKSVHLAAPGTRILSTVDRMSYLQKGYLIPYDYMDGTSMAVPMVTGVAALLYSEFPEITLEEVRESILKGVIPLDTLNNKVSTSGTLSASGAMDYYKNEILPKKIREGLGVKKEENRGEKPKIVFKKNKEGRINLVVLDKDNDVKSIRYEVGKRSLSYFRLGKRGRNVRLTAKNKKGIFLKKGRIYTIYVIDSKGNQTVRVVKMK